MRSRRENCVILDTTILPSRPLMPVIEKFVANKLKLDMSQVMCIQPHNVKNVVYVCMKSSEAACNVAAAHHLKHCIELDGKKFPMPIYVENSAVDVRIHDLPYDMDNSTIVDHLRQYGEVIAIRNEVWKRYFPGLINGVRVARMKLNQPIPSFITVDDEPTLVTYPTQVKTCRNCGRSSHPRKVCSEMAADAASLEANSSNTNNTDANDENKTTNSASIQQLNANDGEQWPALPEPVLSPEQQQRRSTGMKRQQSVNSDTPNNGTKKLNSTNDSDESDSSSSMITVSSDICPYTQRPYNIGGGFTHIKDVNERRALIEEAKQRIDAIYREMETNNKKKNSIN